MLISHYRASSVFADEDACTTMGNKVRKSVYYPRLIYPRIQKLSFSQKQNDVQLESSFVCTTTRPDESKIANTNRAEVDVPYSVKPDNL